jgi:hypothetical protein
LPKDLRQLIREMAADNVTWGEERIANELRFFGDCAPKKWPFGAAEVRSRGSQKLHRVRTSV